MTKTFNDPDGVIAHSKQMEKDKLRAQAESGKTSEDVEHVHKYYPLAPEMWKNSVFVLGNFTVIKFPRVF